MKKLNKSQVECSVGQANYKANSREIACHEVKIQLKEVEHPAQA